MKISKAVLAAMNSYQAPTDIGFGKTLLPVALEARFKGGRWLKPKITLLENIQVSPASKAVQYGQSVFEGMKAFRVEQDIPQVFRVGDHYERFMVSAERLAIAPLPRDLFTQGVCDFAEACKDLIPREPGSALYLRPTLFGDDTSLAIRRSSTYRFVILAAPTSPFAVGMKSVLIERDHVRAVRGGVGNVKAAGNYAPSFNSLAKAEALGCQTSLWLSADKSQNIEELSLMNLFAVINGDIHTPALTGTFLAGLTRDSLISLARRKGLSVFERDMSIDDLIHNIRSGACTELFSCGTAAVVSPIKSLKETDGSEHTVGCEPGPFTLGLRQCLMDIQEGRGADPFDWMQNAQP